MRSTVTANEHLQFDARLFATRQAPEDAMTLDADHGESVAALVDVHEAPRLADQDGVGASHDSPSVLSDSSSPSTH